MGKCYIVGALPEKLSFEKLPGDLVIAADGGFDSLAEAGIEPDTVIGDMDSVSSVDRFGAAEVIRYPVEKDYTDTELAVGLGIRRGYGEFVIYGCAGGLLDHTLGNIALLKSLALRGCRAVLVSGGWGAAALSGGTLNFSGSASGRLSVLSMTDTARGVTIRGMKYGLENAELTSLVTIGVSNEFTGEKASISVKNGVLCVFTALKNLTGCSDLFDNAGGE